MAVTPYGGHTNLYNSCCKMMFHDGRRLSFARVSLQTWVDLDVTVLQFDMM